MSAAAEAQSIPEQVRVIHPVFHAYDEYLNALKKGMKNAPALSMDSTTFKDGSPWDRAIVGQLGYESELNNEPRHTALVPFWISKQFNVSLPEILYDVQAVVNSLTHTERGRRPLAERVIGVSPYIELRMDADGRDEGERTVGEAITAEIIGHNLGKRLDKQGGLDELVLLGAHSRDGIDYLKKAGVKVVPVTAAPVFAEHLNDNLGNFGIDRNNVSFVALDRGSLQQNMRLCQDMGLDLKEHMVVFDKERGQEQNAVKDSKLAYGDPTGRDIIIYDDMIDTYGSMDKTVKNLRETYNCKSITLLSTHGVLSHPSRSTIMKALLKNHSIDRIIMTDSLPRGKYLFENYEDIITSLPTGFILGEIAQSLAETDYETFMTDPDNPYRRFIMEPLKKDEVWELFRQEVGLVE